MHALITLMSKITVSVSISIIFILQSLWGRWRHRLGKVNHYPYAYNQQSHHKEIRICKIPVKLTFSQAHYIVTCALTLTLDDLYFDPRCFILWPSMLYNCILLYIENALSLYSFVHLWKNIIGINNWVYVNSTIQ